MSAEGLVASVVIVLVFAVWIAWPFTRRSTDTTRTDSPAARQRERLLLYYERVLRNVHDLDEDFATGKLNETDFTIERERWVQRGVEALRALETLDGQHLMAPATADEAAIDEAIDHAIEAAIRGYRQPPPESAVSTGPQTTRTG
jgi:hypothetical protein